MESIHIWIPASPGESVRTTGMINVRAIALLTANPSPVCGPQSSCHSDVQSSLPSLELHGSFQWRAIILVPVLMSRLSSDPMSIA
jgi:hypothetical protein